jgi:hypothetical protein
MFEKSLRASVKSDIAGLTSMVSLFQNGLLNTHCQMLIFGFVNAVTRCVSEERQSFIYNRNSPN